MVDFLGEGVIMLAQVSLRDVISSTVEMVAADATKKGLDLAYTMDDALLRRTVLGDAIRIRQVRPAISHMLLPVTAGAAYECLLI